MVIFNAHINNTDNMKLSFINIVKITLVTIIF